MTPCYVSQSPHLITHRRFENMISISINLLIFIFPGILIENDNIYATYKAVIKYMAKLHILGLICAGIQENDLLFALGFYVVEGDIYFSYVYFIL